MTADAGAPIPPAPMTPARALQLWISVQTLKPVPTPGYDPVDHGPALELIGERLLADRSLASGRLSDALRALMANPQMGTAELTSTVFGGTAGYALHVMWPLASIFAGRMPRKVSVSTGKSYLGWVDRIRRVVVRGLPLGSVDGVTAVLDAVSDAYASAVVPAAAPEADAGRLVEAASDRTSVDDPGIYVLTTPTYLAHPPFGWSTEDAARLDFRYLNVVGVSGGAALPLDPGDTGMPEPYIVAAVFRSRVPGADYAAIERIIHRLLAEARHGPERDGTQRAGDRAAGWFITRLPFIVAIAEAVGLELAMTEELRAGVNDILLACQLPDWTLG